MIFCLFLDDNNFFVALKKYYQSDAGLVTSQPVHHRDLAASLLESNLADVTEQQEWETEWNHQGLASGLTEQVGTRI